MANVTPFSGTTPQSLRSHLQACWTASDNLVGATLVGELPHADSWFDDWGADGYASPIDLYYMDLNGAWEDTDGDGVLDLHPNDGNEGPEIWIGRIMTHNVSDTPIEQLSLMEAYFDRAHAYRLGSLQFRESGMVYTLHAARSGPYSDLTKAEVLYPGATTLIMDREIVGYEDYRQRLATENWEWHSLLDHGNPGGSLLPGPEVRDVNPRIGFYDFEICNFADYSYHRYAAGQHIFNTDYGLAAIGHTKLAWSPHDESRCYQTLASGGMLGEGRKAQLEWLAQDGYDANEVRNHFGVTTVFFVF